MESTIKLFKALTVSNHKNKLKPSKEFLSKTLKYGIIFSPEVLANYSEKVLLDIAKEIGLSTEQLNNAFHKSWSKVRDTPIENLVLEQVIHYLTTYGLESVGLYSESTIFIPSEKLDTIKCDIVLTCIKGYTVEEFREKLSTMLSSGIALSNDTIEAIVDVAAKIKFTAIDIVANKEVKIRLQIKLGIIPRDPTEFLRLIIYDTTHSTLIIKDKKTINGIKSSNSSNVLKLFKLYDELYGLELLSSIFYRFKPIFLSIKKLSGMPKYINLLRKLAVHNHKPMIPDYLNNVTANIKDINVGELLVALDKTNIFRKIRLAYALKFRSRDPEFIVYKIRNGKSHAAHYKSKNVNESNYLKIYNIVIDSIIRDLKVKGKKVYIPENIVYALPATEKQFTGMFPSGTCINIPKDMIFGVHWIDVRSHRIDLDLSLISVDGKIGWDRNYRTSDGTILFSGDVTAAPGPVGASELMYIRRQAKESYLVNLNYFNYDKVIPVDFRIVVAQESPKIFGLNYVINPNNIVVSADSNINVSHKILGLVVVTSDSSKFYFCEMATGHSVTSRDNDSVSFIRQYLYNFFTNTISLNDLLVRAGALIVSDVGLCDVDLSPNILEKDTFIKLLTNTYDFKKVK